MHIHSFSIHNGRCDPMYIVFCSWKKWFSFSKVVKWHVFYLKSWKCVKTLERTEKWWKWWKNQLCNFDTVEQQKYKISFLRNIRCKTVSTQVFWSYRRLPCYFNIIKVFFGHEWPDIRGFFSIPSVYISQLKTILFWHLLQRYIDMFWCTHTKHFVIQFFVIFFLTLL